MKKETMELSIPISIKETTFFFRGENFVKQKAEITIRTSDDVGQGKKKDIEKEFIECKFETVESPYTYSDWRFMKAISEKIDELLDNK